MSTLPIGTELDDNAALFVFTRKLDAFFGCRNASVGHPDVSISIHVDSVWPDEHAAAKAPNLLPGLVEEMNRVCLGAEATRGNSRRATVSRPNGLAVAVDGYTVGARHTSTFSA